MLVGFGAEMGEAGLERKRRCSTTRTSISSSTTMWSAPASASTRPTTRSSLVTRRRRARTAEGAEGGDRGGHPRRGRAPARGAPWRLGGIAAAVAVVGRDASSALVANLARVVHAPADTLRLLRALPRRRGARDHRGLPRRREDDAREVARALARPRLLAAPVHARPAAVRRHRRQRLQPAHERVRVPAGPGVRERPARRRDQPRLAEDAVGAARGDAGEPGDDRRRDVRARAARSW